MASGFAGGPRPAAKSKLRILIPLDEPFTSSEMLMAKDISQQQNIDVEINSGNAGGLGVYELDPQDRPEYNHYLEMVINNNIVSLNTLQRIKNTQLRMIEDGYIETTVEGPAGGPRPLASSNLSLTFGSDISDSDVFNMDASERRRVYEDAIRSKLNVPAGTVDVEFAPSKTFILTRRGSISYENLIKLRDMVEEAMDDLDVRIATNFNIVADGE